MEINIISNLYDLSTSEISDALDSLWYNWGCNWLMARNNNHNLAGQAFVVKFWFASEKENAKAADYIDDVPKGNIIVIDNWWRNCCTVWGWLLTEIALIKEIWWVVIDGACRDLDIIKKASLPLFSKHVYMKTGKKRVKLLEIWWIVDICWNQVKHWDYIRGDESGVIVIPKKYIKDVIIKAKKIQNMEKMILEDIKNGIRLDESRKKNLYNNLFDVWNT